jgi:peptidoglycan/LPS O-acetylase OafA/YrhL
LFFINHIIQVVFKTKIDAAFSLYSIHPIVLNVFPKLLRVSGLGIAFNGWIIFAVLLVIILVVSGISFHYIEKRFGAFLSNRLLGNDLVKNKSNNQ